MGGIQSKVFCIAGCIAVAIVRKSYIDLIALINKNNDVIINTFEKHITEIEKQQKVCIIEIENQYKVYITEVENHIEDMLEKQHKKVENQYKVYITEVENHIEDMLEKQRLQTVIFIKSILENNYIEIKNTNDKILQILEKTSEENERIVKKYSLMLHGEHAKIYQAINLGLTSPLQSLQGSPRVKF